MFRGTSKYILYRMSWLSSSPIRKVPEFSEAGVPFTLKSQSSTYCRELIRRKPSSFAVFLNSRAKMVDWPLTRLCEWNWRLCMRTVLVLRTHNCQILTGETFTWFLILSKYSLPFGLLDFFVFVFVYRSLQWPSTGGIPIFGGSLAFSEREREFSLEGNSWTL